MALNEVRFKTGNQNQTEKPRSILFQIKDKMYSREVFELLLTVSE